MPQPDASAVERHPHLANIRPEGWLRVDWHCHTMWSGDSTTTPDELIQAVASTGIDVLCITDHQTVAGANQLADKLACQVVIGEEIRIGRGELIGLFLTDRIPTGLGVLDTAKAIRDQGAIVYIPHPFDPMRNCLAESEIFQLVEAGLVDAIEVFNAKTSLASLQQKAADFASNYGLVAGAGSDAHVPDAFGAAFVEMHAFSDAESFLASARQGSVFGHYFDAHRPWSPRIVPSTD